MLAPQRQDRILAQVHARGAVRVADLVEAFDVSDMTVRRDITELARAGLVRRVHGGAVALEAAARSAHEPRFETKRSWAAAEKAAIARDAFATIEPGQAIALSGGTTTHRLAELLAADPSLRPLTVVTNSLPVADALHHARDAAGPTALEVILTGGVRTPSDALVGPVAEATIRRLRVDQVFLGVHGLDAHGVTTPNLLEAATDQALIASSARLTVLADHSKWGVVGLAQIASLEQVDLLLSDGGLPADACAALEDAVGELRLAMTNPRPTTEDH